VDLYFPVDHRKSRQIADNPRAILISRDSTRRCDRFSCPKPTLPSKTDGCTGQAKQKSHARITTGLRRSSDNKLRRDVSISTLRSNFSPKQINSSNEAKQGLFARFASQSPFEGDETTSVNQDVSVGFPLSACVTHISHKAEAGQTKTRVSFSRARAEPLCVSQRAKGRACNVHMCI